MSEIKNRDQLLKDLQMIKEAASKNNNILKYIAVSEGIKNAALLSASIIIGISAILLWKINIYGSYNALPSSIKIGLYVVLVVSVIGIGWFKSNFFLKTARKHKKDINFINMIKEIYTKTLLIIVIPFFMAIAAFCVYFSISELSHLIVPVLAILVSLFMASVLAFLNLKDFLIYFEWLFISGLFTLFIADKMHPLYSLIVTFGIGMFMLYLSARMSILKEKRD